VEAPPLEGLRVTPSGGLPEDLPKDPPQLLRVLDAVDGGELQPPLVGVRPSDEVAGEGARQERLLAQEPGW
jgi:hypothetical protein